MDKKNTYGAIKTIWLEQNMVELLSAAHVYLADFLPPHIWKRAEGGSGLCWPSQPPWPPPDPVKGPWPPSADRWQERKWRRPAAAPFTPGDRSDPSSQPGWMLLRRPYGSRRTFRFRVAVFLPQRSRLQPTKPQEWTIEPRLGPARLADLQTTTDCFRKCVGMTKIKPTQCDCVPLLSAALDGAQRR